MVIGLEEMDFFIYLVVNGIEDYLDIFQFVLFLKGCLKQEIFLDSQVF